MGRLRRVHIALPASALRLKYKQNQSVARIVGFVTHINAFVDQQNFQDRKAQTSPTTKASYPVISGDPVS
jgi:hypothetical protein